jgi:hypothetical protein
MWYIGYGAKFDESKLKPLMAGSFYTEPPDVAHFAKTGNEPVVLQITGCGPTGTEYVEGGTASVSAKQTNHIVWKDEVDLNDKLIARIQATVPLKHQPRAVSD